MIEKIDELVRYHEKFMREALMERDSMAPMVVYSRNKKITAGVMILDRERMRIALRKIKSLNPDWIVFMFEAYAQKFKGFKDNEEPDIEPGDLKKAFDMHDPTVTEVVTLQVYCGKEKRMLMFEKKGKELVKKCEVSDFSGYLDVMGDDKNE